MAKRTTNLSNNAAKAKIEKELKAAKDRVKEAEKSNKADKPEKPAKAAKENKKDFIVNGKMLAQHEIISEFNAIIAEAKAIVKKSDNHIESENIELAYNEICNLGGEVVKDSKNEDYHDMANLKKANGILQHIKTLNKK